MRTSSREINGGTLRESAETLWFDWRLGDYNSVLLLVDGADASASPTSGASRAANKVEKMPYRAIS